MKTRTGFRILALLASCLLILTGVGGACAEAWAEEVMYTDTLWAVPAAPALTGEAAEAFDRAMETVEGMRFLPVALLGERDGVYSVLCLAGSDEPDTAIYYTIVYADREGMVDYRYLDISPEDEFGPEETGPAEEERTAGYMTVFSDLADAADASRHLAADLAALDDPLASAIAMEWDKVYLSPDYRFYVSGTDDPSRLPVSGKHAFVILGFQLEDGEMADELKARCDAAAEAAKVFPDSILVCSGGATGENNPDGHTEAGLMKEYLVNVSGIAPERIFNDERAMTTLENAINTLKILKEQGIEEITIVSSSYHLRRAQMLYFTLAQIAREQDGYAFSIAGCYGCSWEAPEMMEEVDPRIAAAQMNEMIVTLVTGVQEPEEAAE